MRNWISAPLLIPTLPRRRDYFDLVEPGPARLCASGTTVTRALPNGLRQPMDGRFTRTWTGSGFTPAAVLVWAESPRLNPHRSVGRFCLHRPDRRNPGISG